MSSHSRRDIFPVRVRSSIQAFGKAGRWGWGMGGMSNGKSQMSNVGGNARASSRVLILGVPRLEVIDGRAMDDRSGGDSRGECCWGGGGGGDGASAADG